MPASSKKFKKPSKKHQPKGLEILYEDRDIIVVNKEHGLLTISTEKEREKTAYFLLNLYVKKGNSKSKNRVFIVHRLDRDTSGILVFAKSENAKRYLQDEWHHFSKTYYAVVKGKLKSAKGIITSYLIENKAHKVYSIKDSEKGKLSKTGYKVIQTSDKYSLLEIELFTGRKHQIRVHLLEMGHPVVGDRNYSKKEPGISRLALHAASITINHPFSKEKMTFMTEIPQYFQDLLHK